MDTLSIIAWYSPLLWLLVVLLLMNIVYLRFFAQCIRGTDGRFFVLVQKIKYGSGTEGFKCLQKQKIIKSLIYIAVIVLLHWHAN